MAQTHPHARRCMIALLREPEGFGVELFDQMGLMRLCNGRFGVWYEDSDESHMEEFDEPEEAVDRFLELRDQRELGYDFEAEEANNHQIVS
jgi:hypothetical protein